MLREEGLRGGDTRTTSQAIGRWRKLQQNGAGEPVAIREFRVAKRQPRHMLTAGQPEIHRLRAFVVRVVQDGDGDRFRCLARRYREARKNGDVIFADRRSPVIGAIPNRGDTKFPCRVRAADRP